MKAIMVYFALFFGLVLTSAQNVDSVQANSILKHHFISLNEAKMIYPDLPKNLVIPFSAQTLKNNPDSWLLPVKVKDRFKYLLIRTNFEWEACSLKRIDTLNVATTKEVLKMLYQTRPKFPERENYNYFFRTKDFSSTKDRNTYHKIVAYDNSKFVVINWPDYTEIGVVRQKFIFYLEKNKRGIEIQLGSESLPDYGMKIKNDESVYVLTMFSQR